MGNGEWSRGDRVLSQAPARCPRAPCSPLYRFPIPHSLFPARSVAHLLLAMFPTFLRVEAQGRDRARVEAVDADLLVGFLAEAVTPFLDPLERLVDLGDQLAVAVARAQFERVLGLAR